MIPDLEKDYLYFTRVVKRDLGLDLALYKETQMKTSNFIFYREEAIYYIWRIFQTSQKRCRSFR